jgi:N-acetylglucosamine-6-phosphate deacetylase
VAQRGCQPAQNIREPQPADIDFLLSYSDIVTEVTLAPELPGAVEMIRRLAQADILISAGHSNANEAQVQAGLAAGLRHATHIYSAMSSVRREGPYRRPGLLEMALTRPELTTEMIADGRHLPATLMRLVLACKGIEKVCLVSDAMRGAGLPEGQRLAIAGVEAIIEDGVAIMADRTGFAGSVTPLDQMLRNVVSLLDLPLAAALTMVTRTPAAILHIEQQKGSIAPGMDADLVMLDANLNVVKTIVAGQIAFSRGAAAHAQ